MDGYADLSLLGGVRRLAPDGDAKLAKTFTHGELIIERQSKNKAGKDSEVLASVDLSEE